MWPPPNHPPLTLAQEMRQSAENLFRKFSVLLDEDRELAFQAYEAGLILQAEADAQEEAARRRDDPRTMAEVALDEWQAECLATRESDLPRG